MFLRQQELCSSSTAGRRQPTICWVAFTIPWIFFFCAAREPSTDTVGQDALYCAAIEGHQQSLRDVVLPKNPQEVESRIGLLYQLSSVSSPGKVLADADSYFKTFAMNCFKVFNIFGQICFTKFIFMLFGKFKVCTFFVFCEKRLSFILCVG